MLKTFNLREIKFEGLFVFLSIQQISTFFISILILYILYRNNLLYKTQIGLRYAAIRFAFYRKITVFKGASRPIYTKLYNKIPF